MPAQSIAERQLAPRVGVPYRTHDEEVRGSRGKYDTYLKSIERAGGSPVEISLSLPTQELQELARTLDAVLLPGSPADVDPSLYHELRDRESAAADPNRERTDIALLEHAFGEGKPILAICYGVQILNVYLGGSLIQDISGELHSPIEHAWKGRDKGKPEPFHLARLEEDSRFAELAGASAVRLNSSHHQSVRDLGKNLRIVGRAPDGVVEAVEWVGDGNWVMGVQWHPERMADDTLAHALFQELIAAAREVAVRD
ncbi:MAG TPA: gamma-glutamyl-gamma-aminobutyrate hydrolase family protein [Candidatus Acidoferrales bacterium]|nr:gamma-glutamyl-gamma-aminobutyrate hydrolase family protein [Candidatus Acidoferrales bacterium]